MTTPFKPFPTFELMILSVLAEESVGAANLRSKLGTISEKTPANPQLQLSLLKMLTKGVITRENMPSRPIRGGRQYFKYHITDSGKEIIALYKKLLDIQAGL